MNKILIFILIILQCNTTSSQSQLEFDVYNSFSFLRAVNGVQNQEDSGLEFEEGNTIDFARSSFFIKINFNKYRNYSFNFGAGYSISTDDVDAGESGKPDELIHSYQRYKSMTCCLGINRHWKRKNIVFKIGFDLIPVLIFNRYLTSQYEGNYQQIESNKIGFSHIDTRINFSWIFGNERKSHLLLNTFIRPPSIYVTKMLPDKIFAFHVGLGVGWVFDLKKKE